ncbi:DUF2125 domain-containing protein [Paracoccus aminophilus]|uniref:DUF2125 domain-containing protein n=1 Tax=Paracoccus aminophilus JCM 7686 TaxID=1367847 RepID=S5XSI9_PARAH|nr:DUF2125 domain-containing protein [Paracoccus aminophilus]AGT08072.1 hypothetical protein JCM7686_0963 [Paracoccus aminophilus JCM 7686]
MFRFLIVLIVFLVALGGGWYAAEGYLAREARAALAGNPAISVTEIAELRDPRRIGLRLTEPTFEAGAAQVSAPAVELFARFSAPTTLEADLPPTLAIRPEGAAETLALGLSDARARARVSPLHELQVTRADLSSGAMTLDQAPLASALSAVLQLTALSHDSPKAARAAYDLDLGLAELDLRTLPQLATAVLPEGRLTLSSKGRLWLSSAISVTGGDAPPALVGLRIDDTQLTLGALKVKALGRIQRDANGLSEGELMLYTADLDPLLAFAVSTGAISSKSVPLIKTVLTSLSKATPDPVLAANGAEPAAPAYPAATAGEIRLPLIFTGGKMMLGPLGLGPAPRFPG